MEKLRKILTKENRIEKAELIVKTSKYWHTRTAFHANETGVILDWFFDQKEEAEETLQKAIDLDPQNVSAWNNLGNAYTNQGRYKEAEKTYQKAIDLDPQYVYAWNGLGNVLNKQSRYQEAEKTYRKAIELDPLNSFFMTNLGGACLFYLDRQEEGIALLLQGLSHEPKDRYGRYVLRHCWKAVLPTAADQIVTNNNQSSTDNLRTAITETLLTIAASGEQKTVRDELLTLNESAQQPFEAILLALQALDDRSVLYHIAREKRDVVLDVMKSIAPDDAIN